MAVKLLLELSHDALVMFQRAVATAKFKLPHAISIIDFGVMEGGAPFMVLEHFQGIRLNDYLIEHHATQPVPAMKDVCHGEPPPAVLKALMRRCLEKNPDARFPDMHAINPVLMMVVMQVRIVRMCVLQPFMPVRMNMRFPFRVFW